MGSLRRPRHLTIGEPVAGGAPATASVAPDVIEALAVLACEGDPAALSGDQSSRLLRWVGLTGIEARCAGNGEVAWRSGGGPPGEEVVSGALRVVPLGGRPREGAVWRALLGLLALTASGAGPALAGPDGDAGVHGPSAAAALLRAEVRRVAPSDLAVLVLGETGAGKEVVARAIHRLSGRTGAFVPVNVAAIPRDLLEAELFGSVRGAFTGADRPRQGLVRAAHRGTLLLDEIGDLDLTMQAKLLRVLESGEVRPVGSTTFHAVDARVVSATHRDLRTRMEAGLFRADLYYRLAFAVLRVPPLRERTEDLPLLRRLFADEASRRLGARPCRWSAGAEAALLGYGWPGNVRELRHVVELAVVEAAGGIVTRAMLPLPDTRSPAPQRWTQATADFRRRLLRTTLHRHGGNRTAAARELGISRQTLLYHVRSLGLGGSGSSA